jgi:hypothetical protein
MISRGVHWLTLLLRREACSSAAFRAFFSKAIVYHAWDISCVLEVLPEKHGSLSPMMAAPYRQSTLTQSEPSRDDGSPTLSIRKGLDFFVAS